MCLCLTSESLRHYSHDTLTGADRCHSSHCSCATASFSSTPEAAVRSAPENTQSLFLTQAGCSRVNLHRADRARREARQRYGVEHPLNKKKRKKKCPVVTQDLQHNRANINNKHNYNRQTTTLLYVA